MIIAMARSEATEPKVVKWVRKIGAAAQLPKKSEPSLYGRCRGKTSAGPASPC